MDLEYARMEKAINYIEKNSENQPTLAQISRHVGLSPYHFQRLFKQWTGVSPKKYLQYLTVEKAKELLKQSSSMLDTAFGVGLSGSGRLHDLFISVEAMTPGQFKSGGRGLVISYGFGDTPFGLCLLAATENGVCGLRFIDDVTLPEAVRELQQEWRGAEIREDAAKARILFDLIFDRTGENFPGKVNLHLKGTNFQIKVWEALLRVPEGTVLSYGDLAMRVGRPEAARAVAGAVGSNPVAWLIPCHRVLRKNGEIGGYRWGTARKKAMLARELSEGKVPS